METQSKKKKFEGKVTQLIALDKELWDEFNKLRQPYGTVNDLFEDCVRILLNKEPKHQALLEQFKKAIGDKHE